MKLVVGKEFGVRRILHAIESKCTSFVFLSTTTTQVLFYTFNVHCLSAEVSVIFNAPVHFDASHVASLGAETSKHVHPKLCPKAPVVLALLSFVEERFSQCALMFSIYPAHTNRSH